MYFETKYQQEMPYHVQRWGSSMARWNSEIESIKTFGAYRGDYVRTHIRSQFGISSTHQITLNVDEPGSGKIRINTVTPMEYPWTGIYFDNIPIQLTAIAEPGYRFTGWQGSVESFEKSMSADVLSNMNITAVFEPDGSGLNHIIINEINYNSSPEYNADDWLEIYNGGQDARDISLWKVSDSDNTHVYLIPQNTIIGPGEYLVICRNTSSFVSQYPDVSNYCGNLNFGFASSGDCVRLFTSDGVLVDSVCYKPVYPWPELPDGIGHSLALSSPLLDNDNPDNWISSENTGTPGLANNVITSVEKPLITESFSGPGFISSYPNPFTEHTYIGLHVEMPGRFRVYVCDINGRLIEVLADDYFNSGIYEFRWDASQSERLLPPGIYLVRMESSGTMSVMKITLIK